MKKHFRTLTALAVAAALVCGLIIPAAATYDTISYQTDCVWSEEIMDTVPVYEELPVDTGLSLGKNLVSIEDTFYSFTPGETGWYLFGGPTPGFADDMEENEVNYTISAYTVLKRGGVSYHPAYLVEGEEVYIRYEYDYEWDDDTGDYVATGSSPAYSYIVYAGEAEETCFEYECIAVDGGYIFAEPLDRGEDAYIELYIPLYITFSNGKTYCADECNGYVDSVDSGTHTVYVDLFSGCGIAADIEFYNINDEISDYVLPEGFVPEINLNCYDMIDFCTMPEYVDVVFTDGSEIRVEPCYAPEETEYEDGTTQVYYPDYVSAYFSDCNGNIHELYLSYYEDSDGVMRLHITVYPNYDDQIKAVTAKVTTYAANENIFRCAYGIVDYADTSLDWVSDEYSLQDWANENISSAFYDTRSFMLTYRTVNANRIANSAESFQQAADSFRQGVNDLFGFAPLF